MENQASTSSGGMEQRKIDALMAYRNVSCSWRINSIICHIYDLVPQKMREHENHSQSLKNCEKIL